MLSAVFSSRNQLLGAIVTALFALFIILLPRFTDTAKTLFVLLILTSLGYLILHLNQVKWTSSIERLFFVSMLANFLWMAFSFYYNGEPGRGASFLWGRHFYLLFLIPLFYLFRQFEISDRMIVSTLLCSVVVSLTDISIDLLQGIDHRLQGMNPNAFGPIQLCFTGILFFYFVKLPRSVLKWIALGGAVIGMSTVILSLSKSTLITAMILSVFFGFYLLRSQPAWKIGAVATGFLVMIVSSYSVPMVNKRINEAPESIARYYANDDYRDNSRLGTFGTRMELWKTGWKIFLENPVTGVGVGGFKVMARENSERYQVNEIVHHFKYVHNQYIAALATRGIPGLILFLLFLTLPLYIAMSHRAFDRESEVARLSLMFISLTYLIGCLGEDHFEGKSATMFVAVFAALLLARLSTGKPQQVQAGSP